VWRRDYLGSAEPSKDVWRITHRTDASIMARREGHHETPTVFRRPKSNDRTDRWYAARDELFIHVTKEGHPIAPPSPDPA